MNAFDAYIYRLNFKHLLRKQSLCPSSFWVADYTLSEAGRLVATPGALDRRDPDHCCVVSSIIVLSFSAVSLVTDICNPVIQNDLPRLPAEPSDGVTRVWHFESPMQIADRHDIWKICIAAWTLRKGRPPVEKNNGYETRERWNWWSERSCRGEGSRMRKLVDGPNHVSDQRRCLRKVPTSPPSKAKYKI
jgi:hypothetical protein